MNSRYACFFFAFPRDQSVYNNQIFPSINCLYFPSWDFIRKERIFISFFVKNCLLLCNCNLSSVLYYFFLIFTLSDYPHSTFVHFSLLFHTFIYIVPFLFFIFNQTIKTIAMLILNYDVIESAMALAPLYLHNILLVFFPSCSLYTSSCLCWMCAQKNPAKPGNRKWIYIFFW